MGRMGKGTIRLAVIILLLLICSSTAYAIDDDAEIGFDLWFAREEWYKSLDREKWEDVAGRFGEGYNTFKVFLYDGNTIMQTQT